jgi:signal peptidase I
VIYAVKQLVLKKLQDNDSKGLDSFKPFCTIYYYYFLTELEKVEPMSEAQNSINSTEEPSKKNSELMEWSKALFVAVVLALLIRQFLFAPFVVEGDSMLPNFHDGERLIVNEVLYKFRDPKRDEVIVFHATEQKDYIKRVIGLPGDTVELVNDELRINGQPYEEPYLSTVVESAKMQGTSYNNRDYGPIQVPEGHVVVLGDNRSNSADSRDLGPIPIENIVGRADIVFWPISALKLVNH